MFETINRYNFKVRDAIIASVVIHVLLIVFLQNEENGIIPKKELWDTKPMKFIFPDQAADDFVPDDEAPYSDADRMGRSREEEKITDKINPQKRGLTQFERTPPSAGYLSKNGGDHSGEPAKNPQEKALIPNKSNDNRSERKSFYRELTRQLKEHPSKYMDSAEIFKKEKGSVKKIDDIDLLEGFETRDHPCWGTYPLRIQEIVRNRLVIPEHLFYTRAITVLRFRLLKSGEVKDLRIYKSTGNRALNNITYYAINDAIFPPYDCPFESVKVQYTFYLNYDYGEIEDVGNY